MTEDWVIERAEIDDVRRLAHYLALFAQSGDFIVLEGELGTGKTTFARFFISALTGIDEGEISSPTFPLVQAYKGDRFGVHHYDFYRLSDPSEALELGIDEAVDNGVVVVEWPERARDQVPTNHLSITISDTDNQNARRLSLARSKHWRTRLDRLATMLRFVTDSEWCNAVPKFLQGDASTRSYARLHDGDAVAILMNSPQQPDGPPLRDGHTYSRIAHLAEDVRPFVAVAGALRQLRLSTPKIFHHDFGNGFLLLEDFGDNLFAHALARGYGFVDLYGRAVDVLAHIANHPPCDSLPLPNGTTHRLSCYDEHAFLVEVCLLTDWYLPAIWGKPSSADQCEEFVGLWRAILTGLTSAKSWVLRDYHSPNLLVLDDRKGLEKIGILDFQDAVRGHAAYDHVSLAQDARLDVPTEVEVGLMTRYCGLRQKSDPNFDRQAYEAAYAILGAQRNTKILGIFARLAMRDGKRAYLQHLPRIRRYLDRNLAHPALSVLRDWYNNHLPSRDVDCSSLGLN